MGRMYKLLLGLSLLFNIAVVHAQSSNKSTKSNELEEGAAQVWEQSETTVKKRQKKFTNLVAPSYTLPKKKKARRVLPGTRRKQLTKAPRSKRVFKKRTRRFRPLGKRFRDSKAYEWPRWLIDLNWMTTAIFFGLFFGGVVSLYFLLRPDILLSFYQLLLLAAAFAGTLFWYLILGTEQGFDVATWKFFFKHGWLSFPLIFGIYFGFRLLFNASLMIPFPQLMLIGFLIGLVFLILSFIINY